MAARADRWLEVWNVALGHAPTAVLPTPARLLTAVAVGDYGLAAGAGYFAADVGGFAHAHTNRRQQGYCAHESNAEGGRHVLGPLLLHHHVLVVRM